MLYVYKDGSTAGVVPRTYAHQRCHIHKQSERFIDDRLENDRFGLIYLEMRNREIREARGWRREDIRRSAPRKNPFFGSQ